jgi:hypothetical protein
MHWALCWSHLSIPQVSSQPVLQSCVQRSSRLTWSRQKVFHSKMTDVDILSNVTASLHSEISAPFKSNSWHRGMSVKLPSPGYTESAQARALLTILRRALSCRKSHAMLSKQSIWQKERLIYVTTRKAGSSLGYEIEGKRLPTPSW